MSEHVQFPHNPSLRKKWLHTSLILSLHRDFEVTEYRLSVGLRKCVSSAFQRKCLRKLFYSVGSETTCTLSKIKAILSYSPLNASVPFRPPLCVELFGMRRLPLFPRTPQGASTYLWGETPLSCVCSLVSSISTSAPEHLQLSWWPPCCDLAVPPVAPASAFLRLRRIFPFGQVALQSWTCVRTVPVKLIFRRSGRFSLNHPAKALVRSFCAECNALLLAFSELYHLVNVVGPLWICVCSVCLSALCTLSQALSVSVSHSAHPFRRLLNVTHGPLSVF